jgi:hypothetical protein
VVTLIAELDLELKILAMAGVLDVNLTGTRVLVQSGLNMGASLTVLYLLESQESTVPLQMCCTPA